MALPELPDAKFVIREGGFESAYFTLGPEDGLPVLLLHGLAANSLQFVRDATYLSFSGYRVVVPDLRGHGRSRVPDQFERSDFTRALLMEDIVAILDEEQIDQVVWVGNSLGGILALEMMQREPERLHKVIMFGTAFSLNIPDMLVNALSLGYRTIGTTAPAFVGAPLTSRYPEAQEVVHAMLASVQVDPMLHVGAEVARYNLFDAALGFQKPFLMIRAEWDEQVNAANVPFMEEVQGSSFFSLKELAAAGHVANLDQPDTWREFVVDFIEATLPV